MITLDGWVSAWERGPQILYSESVLLAVDSNWSPLYQSSFVPYKHYIPVKHDLSNLLSQIKWLQEHDSVA